jgi:hypothetical protein
LTLQLLPESEGEDDRGGSEAWIRAGTEQELPERQGKLYFPAFCQDDLPTSFQFIDFFYVYGGFLSSKIPMKIVIGISLILF